MNALRMLVPAPLRPAARQINSFIRNLRPVSHNAPFTSDCRATVAVGRR